MKTFSIIISFIFISLASYSQSAKGRIIDSKSANALAFVNILFDNTSHGTSSDIDGYFMIKNISNIDSLLFRYVGYKDITIAVDSFDEDILLVKMEESNYILDEVSIFAKENPAHRIIKNCTYFRKDNDPENLQSFSYNAYHKMIFTAKSSAESQRDSIESDDNSLTLITKTKQKRAENNSLKNDTLNKKTANIFKTQHLFVMESVSNHTYKKPDKHYEKVVGTRISGLQDPLFVMLANQFQSFSFYGNNINLLDKQYVNPISNGSTKKYFFLLEDTILNNKDTVFVISFRPRKATTFEGMKGLLYINTNKYAIQNVIAEPADTSNSFGIKIQQKYEFIDSNWFPVQLNTNLEFGSSIDLNGEPLVGIGKSYITDIKINNSVKATKFSNVVLDIDRNASQQDESFWQKNRTLALDSLELKTYKVIDSIGRAEHFDRKLWFLKTLSKGNIPYGIIDIQLIKIIKRNEFEGLRLGLGIQTNDRFSKLVNISGYNAWTFGDKKWKYGAEFKVKVWRKHNMYFDLGYKDDVVESGKQFEFASTNFINNNIYRNILIKNMVYSKDIYFNVKFRAIPHTSWNLGASYQDINSPKNYLYILYDRDRNFLAQGDYDVFETHIGMRFAYKEKIIRNKLYQISLGTKYPVLNINYTNAIKGVLNSVLTYQKLDLQLDFSYNIKYIGWSYWRITAAKSIGELPWYKLYNGKGSYVPFMLEAPYSFETMRINEFISDQFVAVYLRHDFGSLLFGDKPFVPHPVLISNFTIGSLQNPNKHKNITFNTLEMGYYESGLMLNSILQNSLIQIGFGIMYRYGPYSFITQKDNFSYRLTLGFGI